MLLPDSNHVHVTIFNGEPRADVTEHGSNIFTDGESTLAVGRGVGGGGTRVSQVLPAEGQDRDSELRCCDNF